MNGSGEYCPACRGHGTDVHECEDLKSAVIAATDLAKLLAGFMTNPDCYDPELVQRVVDVIGKGSLNEVLCVHCLPGGYHELLAED